MRVDTSAVATGKAWNGASTAVRRKAIRPGASCHDEGSSGRGGGWQPGCMSYLQLLVVRPHDFVGCQVQHHFGARLGGG